MKCVQQHVKKGGIIEERENKFSILSKIKNEILIQLENIDFIHFLTINGKSRNKLKTNGIKK